MAAHADIWEKSEAASLAQNQLPQPHGSAATNSSRGSNGIINAGDFRIDVSSRSATVRGRELHLSDAEFDVLVFLTSHRKRIVTTRTKLATKSEDSGVHQTEFLPALFSLRKKLHEEVPGVPYINTDAWILFEFHPGTTGR